MGRKQVAKRRWPTMLAVTVAAVASMATSRQRVWEFEPPVAEQPMSMTLSAEQPTDAGRFTVDFPVSHSFGVVAAVNVKAELPPGGEDIPTLVRGSLWALRGATMMQVDEEVVAIRPGGDGTFWLRTKIREPEDFAVRAVAPLEVRLEWLQPQPAELDVEWTVKGEFVAYQPFPEDKAGLDFIVVHLPDEAEPLPSGS